MYQYITSKDVLTDKELELGERTQCPVDAEDAPKRIREKAKLTVIMIRILVRKRRKMNNFRRTLITFLNFYHVLNVFISNILYIFIIKDISQFKLGVGYNIPRIVKL